MKQLRKFLFWSHLVIGLLIGLGVASLATTGLLMAFAHPILDWVEQPSAAAAAPPAGVAITDTNHARPVTQLVRAAMQAVPDASPSAIRRRHRETRIEARRAARRLEQQQQRRPTHAIRQSRRRR